MSTSMFCCCERLVGNVYIDMNLRMFRDVSYGMYGFLADVRNYSCIQPICDNRGMPDNISDGLRSDFEPKEHGEGLYSVTWFTVDELRAYDYSVIIEDRRTSINGCGRMVCAMGDGKIMSLRDFLGVWYFDELNRAKELGVNRFIVGFE